uniref:Uncharacterized protein n=1 Tax=Nelumbo nucifera TaxID=4432 RepID=A0A822ZE84_NELNU|nr:TPA_asm: hypothetical protein HUJ06_002724 [Nelumbo nucifera]
MLNLMIFHTDDERWSSELIWVESPCQAHADRWEPPLDLLSIPFVNSSNSSIPGSLNSWCIRLLHRSSPDFKTE